MDRIVSQRVLDQRWYEKYPRLAPVGAFILTMMLVMVGVAVIERAENARRATQAQAAAVVVAATMDRRAHAYVSYLRAGALLLSGAHEPTHEDLDVMAGGLLDDAEYHGAQGIGWAPFIDAAHVPALEKTMRAAGFADYTVHPAPRPGVRVVPVAYIADMNNRNRAGLGFDLYSEPKRRAALDRAIASHRLAATSSVRLVMTSLAGEWQGFVLFMPVYAPNRPDMPRGVIVAPFNLRAFLMSIVDLEKLQTLRISAYSGDVAPDSFVAGVGPMHERGVPVARQSFDMGGQTVVITVDVPAQGLSPTSWLVLAVGLAVALLVTVMAHVVTRRAAEDRASLIWLREQASIRASLTRELNHRVKNTLANVLSLIALTRRRASGLDDFVEGLEGRIRALSATHDLLTDREWGVTPLRQVAQAELAPYVRPGERSVNMRGPDVDLAPNDALSLGLALHELATNAAKYGALSVNEGRVELVWSMQGERVVRVHWHEIDGPLVPSARGRGFGTELIERIVAHELGHQVELDFAATGLRCTLMVPVRRPSTFRLRAKGRKGKP